jgi:ABC-type amino acid transport substrate-binding protein
VDTEFPLYVGVNKGNPELATLLDAGIHRLKRSDTLKQLLRKYRISNWK